MKEIEITLEELQEAMTKLPDKKHWYLLHRDFPYRVMIVKQSSVFRRETAFKDKEQPKEISFYLDTESHWKPKEKLIIV